MSELAGLLHQRFERALCLDELETAASLLQQWQGHLPEPRPLPFRLAELRLWRAQGRIRASRQGARTLLEEGLATSPGESMGASMLAGRADDGSVKEQDLPVTVENYWLQVELQRYHRLSPEPGALIRWAEALESPWLHAHGAYLAVELCLRQEAYQRLVPFYEDAKSQLESLDATYLLMRLELLATMACQRQGQAERARSHLDRARGPGLDQRPNFAQRLHLWSSLLHLLQAQGGLAADDLERVGEPRDAVLLLGLWAGRAALAWDQGQRERSAEHLLRLKVAQDRLAVGSLAALGFLEHLADQALAGADAEIAETALRSALNLAGRTGLARTITELSDRLSL